MGGFLIKCAKDVDLYMEWSTVVDAPMGVGTREQFKNAMNTPVRGEYWATESQIEARMVKTDELGSSYDLGCGRWDDSGLIYKQEGILPRKNFLAYAKKLLEDENAEPTGLLEPFEDDK